jgi:hypothetical protein
MNGGVERDRRIADELTRFLIRDKPDGRVADDHAAAPEEPRQKADRRTDLLISCLISRRWRCAAALRDPDGRDRHDQPADLRHRTRRLGPCCA